MSWIFCWIRSCSAPESLGLSSTWDSLRSVPQLSSPPEARPICCYTDWMPGTARRSRVIALP